MKNRTQQYISDEAFGLSLAIGNRVFAPRLVPSLVFVLLFALLLSLGNWQWSRAAEKQVLIDAKQSRQAAPALQLSGARVDPLLDRFRAAEVSGRYLPGQQWLLDNRIYQGLPGYHVFSRFEADSGQQLLVNRGWVSVGESRALLPHLPLPEGPVTLKGNLDSPESVGLVMGEPPLASLDKLVVLQHLSIQDLAQEKAWALLPLALVLREGDAGALQYDWLPKEAISPEKHVGYAVQWFALASALLIIFVGVNTRRKGDGES